MKTYTLNFDPIHCNNEQCKKFPSLQCCGCSKIFCKDHIIHTCQDSKLLTLFNIKQNSFISKQNQL